VILNDRIFDYWHPVWPGRQLKPGRAIAVMLAGRAVAIFRTADQQLGAVADHTSRTAEVRVNEHCLPRVRSPLFCGKKAAASLV
jgi:hypothetical protein